MRENCNKHLRRILLITKIMFIFYDVLPDEAVYTIQNDSVYFSDEVRIKCNGENG